MSKNIIELKREKAQVGDKLRKILNIAKNSERSLTDVENQQYETLLRQMQEINFEIEAADQTPVMAPDYSGVQHRSYNASLYHPTRIKPDRLETTYATWLRSGDPGAQAELRASNDTTMNITTAADGGNLVPTGHWREIVEKLRPLSLADQLSLRQISGQGTTVNVPIDGESDNGAFVSTNESGNFDRDAPAVDKVAFTLTKFTKKLDLTQELLQDEDSNLLSFLSDYVASGMAATLNNLIVTEALAGGTAALTFDAAATIGDLEPTELFYLLGDRYANSPGVAWLMKRSTEGVIRSMQGDTFLYTPTPAGRPGQRGELLGAPVFNAVDMPAIGASNKSLLIANWNYVGIRLEPGLTVLRDPYSRAAQGEVLLHYYFRVDVETLQSEAIAYATHPSA